MNPVSEDLAVLSTSYDRVRREVPVVKIGLVQINNSFSGQNYTALFDCLPTDLCTQAFAGYLKFLVSSDDLQAHANS